MLNNMSILSQRVLTNSEGEGELSKSIIYIPNNYLRFINDILISSDLIERLGE